MLLIELLVTTCYLFCLFGLGAGLSGFFSSRLTIVYSTLFGAGLFSLVIGSLGNFLPLSWIIYTLLIGGVVGGILHLKSLKIRFDVWSRQFTWPVWAYLCIGLLWSMYPSSYFDPLNYHLFGVVRWMDADALIFIPDLIQIVHNSYADYLYLPFALIFARNTESLISLQICAQLLTFILGVCSFSVLFSNVFRSKLSPLWLSLFLIILLSRASLQHKAFIAKNDWIALSWFFAGAIVLFLNPGKRRILLGSIFLGLSIGTKFSYLPGLAILYGSLLLSRHVGWKTLIKSLLLVVAVTLPYFMRNYLWTRNPFFPMAIFSFSSGLGPSWVEGMKSFSLNLTAFHEVDFMDKLRRLFTYDIVVYLFPLSVLFLKRLGLAFRFMLLGIWVVGFLFIFCFGPMAEVRHFGMVALGVNFFAVWTFKLILEKFNLSQRAESIVLTATMASIFLNPLLLNNELNPTPSAFREGVPFQRDKGLIVNQTGLELSRELASFTDRDSMKLALIDDTPPYFFARFRVSRIWDDPALDRALDGCLDLSCILGELEKKRFTHLIDTDFIFDPYYRPHVLGLLKVAEMACPECVYKTSNEEKLVSLKRLREASLNGRF